MPTGYGGAGSGGRGSAAAQRQQPGPPPAIAAPRLPGPIPLGPGRASPLLKGRTVPLPLPVRRTNNVRRKASTMGDGPLLGPQLDAHRGRVCLVLDLDETLGEGGGREC